MDAIDRSPQNSAAVSAPGADRETLYMLGGVALVVFGAGLILSSPAARRLLGQVGIGDLTQGAFPDVERYLKLRAM